LLTRAVEAVLIVHVRKGGYPPSRVDYFVALQPQSLPQRQALLHEHRSPQVQRVICARAFAHPHEVFSHRQPF